MKYTIITREELRDCFGIIPSGLYINGEKVALPQELAEIVLNTPHPQVDELGDEWSELNEPMPTNIEEDVVVDYESEVIRRIREKYTIDEEFAILRQRDSKVDEFNAYYNYCESVKNEVKQLIQQQ